MYKVGWAGERQEGSTWRVYASHKLGAAANLLIYWVTPSATRQEHGKTCQPPAHFSRAANEDFMFMEKARLRPSPG